MTIIAIDGPSGSGKSTVARIIAERLDLPYLDTGAMYRSVALVSLKKGISPSDAVALEKIAAETKMEMLDEHVDGKLVPRVMVNGVDATTAIRTPEVSQAASAIAVHPAVRERLVRRQRNWVELRGGGVVEGRDIGSVVLPEADLKVFLTAGDEERAKRRIADGAAPGFETMSESDAARELVERDIRDSTRVASPLTAVAGAMVVDTTGRDIEDVVIEILRALRENNDAGSSSAGSRRR